MTYEEAGGSAFPITNEALGITYLGISARDYFAAKAMAAMCTFEIDIIFDGTKNDQVPRAKAAYLIADAMLEARK